jgi:hypothetical protein
MLSNIHSIAPIAARVGRSLAAGLLFLRKNKTTSTTRVADDLWLSTATSAFAEIESTQRTEVEPEEDVNPLVEAEIYVIFGRKNDAENVLKSALQAGRINADEVVRFWNEMEAE